MTTGRQKSGKVFYGWWVVLAAGVGLAVHSGPIIVSTFGVFFKPLSQEFGWSRAEVSLAFSLWTFVAGGAVLVVGRLVDRLGARTVILPSVVLFGLGVLSFSSLSASLWHFYALYLGLGVVGSGTTPVGYSKVISHWFDKRRGLALALAMAGVSVGAFFLAPMAQALVTAIGWRQTYVVLGLLTIAGTLPVVGLLLKESPQLMGLAPDGVLRADAGIASQDSQGQGLSGREAWHSESFWLMVGAFFLASVSFHGCIIHLVPLLTDRGFTPRSAALATSVVATGGFVGRLGCGYLLDRVFAPYVAVGFFGAAALGIGLLWSGVESSLAFVAAVLLGLLIGAELDLMAYMVSRYFGLRAFGENYSYVFAAFVLGGGIGPLLMGVGLDATGSYSLVLGGLVVSVLTAAVLLSRLGPYQVWEVGAEPAVAASVSRV
jgi:MFS family permease